MANAFHCVAPDKDPRMAKTEVAGKRFIAELRARHPQVSWRLLREDGGVSAG